MSIKLRNQAGDSSVTLIDGGPAGSTSLTLDVRDILHIDSNHAGRRWDVAAEYRAGDLVTKPHTFAGGFEVDEYFVSQTNLNVGQDPSIDKVNWKDASIVRYISENIQITIGAAGDFQRLDDALLYMARFVVVDGKSITFRVLTGHVIDYHIELRGISIPNASIVATGVLQIDCAAAAGKNGMFEFLNSVVPHFNFDANIINGDHGNPNFTVFHASSNSRMSFYGSIPRTITLNFTNGYFGRLFSWHSGSSGSIREFDIDCIANSKVTSCNLIAGFSGSNVTCYNVKPKRFMGNSAFYFSGVSGFMSGCSIDSTGKIAAAATNGNENINYGAVAMSGCTLNIIHCNMRRDGTGGLTGGSGTSTGGSGTSNRNFGDLAVRSGGKIAKAGNAIGGMNVSTNAIHPEGIIFNGD